MSQRGAKAASEDRSRAAAREPQVLPIRFGEPPEAFALLAGADPGEMAAIRRRCPDLPARFRAEDLVSLVARPGITGMVIEIRPTPLLKRLERNLRGVRAAGPGRAP